MRDPDFVMSEDPKDIVEQAYDNIADWYLDWVQSERSPRERYAQMILDNSTSFPRILELGCGPGIPIPRMLLDQGAQVVANDISRKQIQMAKGRCPEATFVQGDMTGLTFDEESFDGASCFYTIFHLPREEQKTMLEKIHSWLSRGAMFVLNFATIDGDEIHGEMMGHGMFWSSYGVEDSKAMITNAGFDIVKAEVLEAGDGKLAENDADYGVKFLWVAAQKPLLSDLQGRQDLDSRAHGASTVGLSNDRI